MAEHLRRQPRHPIAKRYPQEAPVRTEVLDKRMGFSRDVILDENGPVCSCYPRPSTHTIPSMFYDAIKCPHKNRVHIQPAQETLFNYPWTANSLNRLDQRPRRMRYQQDITSNDDSDDEVLSLISEENDGLENPPPRRAGPRLRNRPKQEVDAMSVATAPPFRYMPDNDPRQDPPYTAPEQATDYLAVKRRVASVEDVRHVRHRPKDFNKFLDDDDPKRMGNSRLSNRSFTGSYVDPSKCHFPLKSFQEIFMLTKGIPIFK